MIGAWLFIIPSLWIWVFVMHHSDKTKHARMNQGIAAFMIFCGLLAIMELLGKAPY